MDDNEQVVGGAVMTPDGQQIPLSADQAQAIKDATDAVAAQRKTMVRELLDLLIDKRERVIRIKRDIEKRWIDDIRQWNGEGRLLSTKEFPSQNANNNAAPPRPHLTRSRCDLWESRMVDLLAPTNDPVWDLRPLCEEDQQFQQGGVAFSQDYAQIKEQAEAAAEGMKRVIRDQLAKCNATKVIRRMCKDACRLGTGLIMGPMNGTHVKRKYSTDPNNPVKVQIEETIVPEIREGDPWMFFPDMVESADKAEFAFYMHPMSQTELWQFADYPGVDKEEVKQLISEPPQYGEIINSVRERSKDSGFQEDLNNRYAVWRYTGVVDQRYLEALNLGDEQQDGIVFADIWFANTRILKAKVSVLASAHDFRIPYFVFSPFPIDDTMFGGSIPYLCRDSQRVADSALLIALNNASVSGGPQIFMRNGKFRPQDGKFSIRGPKIWHVLDDNTPISEMMQSVTLQSNADEAMSIYDAAKQLMDEELNTVQWASPDTAEETQTASGLAMLMNARTILQRRVCATADDDVFQPMIERFILWNLMFNQRQDIKGDFDVQPLCQSVRLVKDIQIQQKLFVMQSLATQPAFQGMFSPYDMVQDIIKTMDVQVDNWLVPKEQWQQAQQQQAQNPQVQMQQQIQAANLQLLQAKTKTEQGKQAKMFNDSQAAGQAQADASGQQAVSADRMLDHQEFMVEKQVQAQQYQNQLAEAQMDSQTKQQVAAMKAQSDRERTNAMLQSAGSKNRTDLIKTSAHAHVELTKAGLQHIAATQAPKLPQGKFTAPKVPRYTGGKRPGA